MKLAGIAILLFLLVNATAVDIAKCDPGFWPVSRTTEKAAIVPSGKIEIFSAFGKRQLGFTELRLVARCRSGLAELYENTTFPLGVAVISGVFAMALTTLGGWSLWWPV
jgi:hypothetical protein